MLLPAEKRGLWHCNSFFYDDAEGEIIAGAGSMGYLRE